MRVLILGASGLIGSAVAARLAAQGDTVVAITRTSAALGLIPAVMLRLDVADARNPADWLPRLAGIDAVVNCAGVLQDSPTESTAGVHVDGVSALFQACETAGVRRVVQLSAVGIDREAPTPFSQTKLAGDQALMARDLDWVILRPSVVIGRAAYGASALFRGLAALPLLPVMPDTAELQIVHLDDVVAAIVYFLRPDAPSRQVLEVVGPPRRSFEEVVRLLRTWMRLPPAKPRRLPAGFAALLYRLGDLVSLLGWRPPIRSTARREIMRGAVGDPAALAAFGIRPKDVEVYLRAEPSSVQERWFARMYFVKPLIIVVLSLFWVVTGVIALGPGWAYGMNLMREGGVGDGPAALTVLLGALADIVIGCAIAWRPATRYGLYAALAISLTYATIGTILVPRLWSDPLGPMLKIWPVMVLHLAALAVLEDR